MNSHILEGPTTKAPAKRVILQDSGLTVYRIDPNESLTVIPGHVKIIYCDRPYISVRYYDGLGVQNGIRTPPWWGDPVDGEFKLSRRIHRAGLALKERMIPHGKD